MGRERKPPSLPLKDIAQRATWPTFNRASLFNLPSEAALVAYLQEQGRWHDIGLRWRNQFLLLGEVYVQKCSGFAEQTKLILARQQNQLFHSSYISRERLFFYAPSPPVWISWLGWDDFQAVPCSAVSPLGAFAQQLTATPAAGIWLQQTADYRPVLEHAARKGFKGLTDGDLKTLAKERELDVAGSDC